MRLPCLCGLRLKGDNRIFFAGQITGVEGYMESTAMGLLAGIAALCFTRSEEVRAPPAHYVHRRPLPLHRDGEKDFQPMNINFGLLEDYDKRKKTRLPAGALAAIAEWRAGIEKALG